MAKKTTFINVHGGKRQVIVKLDDDTAYTASFSPTFETDDERVIKALKTHPRYGTEFLIADERDFRKFRVSIHLDYEPPVWASRNFDPEGENFVGTLKTILMEIFNEVDGDFYLDKVTVEEITGKKEKSTDESGRK